MKEVSYKEQLHTLFLNAYVESNKNHDEALNVYERYCSLKKCKLPVLVNYDSHNDVYLYEKTMTPNIAQWVNYCFSKFGVREYYWLLPNYMKSKNKKNTNLEEDYMGLNIKQLTSFSMIYDPLTKKLINQKAFNATNEKLKKYGLPEFIPEQEGIFPITIYVLPFNEFSFLKGKEIALSVDADAFCNSGYDTNDNENNLNMTSIELKEEFKIFINELYDNGIKINVASLTRSPAYFPEKFQKEITEFFEEIKSAAGISKAV